MASRRARTDPGNEVWGLSPKRCRCPTRGERVVALRQRGLLIAGMPVLTLDAVWRTCTACDRVFALPRLGLGTTVTLTLVILALLGANVPLLDPLVTLIIVAGLWGLWMVQHAAEAYVKERLTPLSRHVRNSAHRITTVPEAGPPSRS